jgi:hypothetical protein
MSYIPPIERLTYKLFNERYLATISGGWEMEYTAGEKEEWWNNTHGTNISVYLFTAPTWYILSSLYNKIVSMLCDTVSTHAPVLDSTNSVSRWLYQQ